MLCHLVAMGDFRDADGRTNSGRQRGRLQSNAAGSDSAQQQETEDAAIASHCRVSSLLADRPGIKRDRTIKTANLADIQPRGKVV